MDYINKQIKVQLQEFMGSDQSIADAAWTSSYDIDVKSTKTVADVERVVRMLAECKHSVPFESVVFRFWIRLPIQTDRQHMTHRIASHSGMSGRYRTMPSDYLEIPPDVDNIISLLPNYEYIKHTYKLHCDTTNKFYNDVVAEIKNTAKQGIIDNTELKRAREFFRGVLPQNNMTERVTVMNLRSFSNYYKLRSKSDAQPEIRQIAELMLESIIEKNICPIAIKALSDNNWSI